MMNNDCDENLQFKKLELEDADILREYLSKNHNRLCDWTIGGTIMWRDYFNMEYAIWNNSLIIKLDYLRGIKGFSFLSNDNISGVTCAISKYCKRQEIPMVLCLVDENTKEVISEFGDSLHVIEESDWFDYLYREEDVSELSGKKYATQRNHINKFKNMYKYDIVNFSEDIKEDVKTYLLSFFKDIDEDDKIKIEELSKSIEVFENNNIYKFDSLVMYIQGTIVGVVSGELVGDTLYIHIQKASKEYSGIYAFLNNIFVSKYKDKALYVNMEEDVGDEGLRYTKEKYRPISKIKKHTIEYFLKG